MSREEAIMRLKNIDIREALQEDYDAVEMAIEALSQQEPCDDEYIKVPKKALKYRTAGMVAYNVEWLKNHFDIERAVICGAQEPCEDVPDNNVGEMDCISRQAAIDAIQTLIDDILHRFEVTAGVEKRRYMECLQIIRELPSVKPEPYKEDNNGKNNSN